MADVIAITECRICGNQHLVEVVNLGEHYLSGVFPKSANDRELLRGPLRLVKCHGSEDVCGLLQLDRTFDLSKMYGDNYGYRSGLNRQMVEHLKAKVASITQLTTLSPGDLIIDIGSNDGTTLAFYPDDLTLVGVDPSGEKFKRFYAPHTTLIPDFFSAALVTARYAQQAKVITSFSMFYDLEDPIEFARGIAEVLDPRDGIWVFEQSYMPTMLKDTAFDTICQEHLEYYGLRQIEWILDRAGLTLVDVELNDVNGGSFSVVAAHKSSPRSANLSHIEALRGAEAAHDLMSLRPYDEFRARVSSAKHALTKFVTQARAEGKSVAALGASTKGNVVLQYCGFTRDDIAEVGDVNPDKFGALTPGTWIPIVEETAVLKRHHDYLIVLPWHFRRFFLASPSFKGQTLVFLLPELEVVSL